VRKKPKAGTAGGSNLASQTTKNAVLHTTSSKDRKEIKRIPSKTKVYNQDGKKKRKQGTKQNYANQLHHGTEL